MRPTFLGFETQKRTLQVAQKNLDIAGNNISNINTVGYTRQRVDLYAMYVSGNRASDGAAIRIIFRLQVRASTLTA